MKTHRLSHVLGALALLLLSACTVEGAERELYRDAAAWLNEHALPQASVAAPPAAARYLDPRAHVELPAADAFDLLARLDEVRPDYALAVDTVAWDGVRAQPWFQARYRPVATWDPAYAAAAPATLYAYRPSPFDGINGGRQGAAEAQFATEAVILRGYDLGEPRIVPGEPLHLTLTWDDVPGHDYTGLHAVVRLVDPAGGTVWAEAEGRLGASGVSWDPDGRLAAEYTLLPPAEVPEGAYDLTVTLRQENGAPVPVETASGEPADALRLTSITHPPNVSRTPIPVDHPLDARFGGADGPIGLRGYDAPTRVAPGDAVRIALHWVAHARIATDYTVFVHLLSPAGEVVAQDDAKPVYWFYPTTEWAPGDYVRDEHVVELPPDLPQGDYTIAVGLYDAETGERAEVGRRAEVVTPAPADRPDRSDPAEGRLLLGDVAVR
jgi:hypothetical protein